MDVRREQNFFEGRVTEYQQAVVAGRRRRRGALAMLDFPEILQDLELKRAAALPREERPADRR